MALGQAQPWEGPSAMGNLYRLALGKSTTGAALQQPGQATQGRRQLAMAPPGQPSSQYAPGALSYAPGAPQQMQGAAQGLPATGIQQQLASLSQFYNQVQGANIQGLGNIGFNPYQFQQQQALAGGGVSAPGTGGTQMRAGQVNIQQLARQLAQQYGLPMGRGELVDPSGNFLVTPEQLSAASGGQETMGMAAAKMNYIAQAIANEQNRQQQTKGISAVSAGLGLVQQRGRGSLAALQSGMYESIADLYANQEYEAADFSYFIEEERFRMQMELQRRAEELAKKKARSGMIGGAIMGGIGLLTGNVGLAVGGLGQAFGSAGGTGWF